MNYWVRGSDDKETSNKIRYAFYGLGYGDVVSNFTKWLYDSPRRIHFTIDGDEEVHSAFEGTLEYSLLMRLIELDDNFVELNPDDIVTTPKFELHDVLYNVEKMFRRCVIIDVDKYKQIYTVKDHNNSKFTINFKDQDQWGVVIEPKFKEATTIKDGVYEVYIVDVESMWQRYKVCEDGADDCFYIPFTEQDHWALT